MQINLKKDYNLTKHDLHIIENLVNTVKGDNLVDVKVFFNYLLDFYTSKQLINMFKVGVSTYYDFYSNHKVNTLKQNRFYKKMRDLFLHIHLGGFREVNKMKLTEKEVEVLKVLSFLGYEWLARDENKGLYTYAFKPEKRVDYWFAMRFIRLKKIDTSFNFIKWADDEPTSISDLLKRS